MLLKIGCSQGLSLQFFDTLNNYHQNFKFTINHSSTDIPFLDVKVIKVGIGLQTTIYTKPTDKKLYLNFKKVQLVNL